MNFHQDSDYEDEDFWRCTHKVCAHDRIHYKLSEAHQVCLCGEQKLSKFAVAVIHEHTPGKIQRILFGNTSLPIASNNKHIFLYQLSIADSNVIWINRNWESLL